MHKLQFLCTNHRTWLSDNPKAAASTWSQTYSRSLELCEECRYSEALRYAGAAFEAADMLLNQEKQIRGNAINRFCDSAALLVQLLYRLEEKHLARTILAAAIDRMNKLPGHTFPRSLLLQGCQRLMAIENDIPSPDLIFSSSSFATSTPGSAALH